MNPKKMIVVLLTKTNAVLGVATRRAPGPPAVADLVGPGLLLRMTDEDATIAVPPDELSTKEVDYLEDVVRQPLGHVIDSSGTVVTPPINVSGISSTNLAVTVTVSAAPAADKTVLVVIDGGPNQPPLKFVAKTAQSVAATVVPISSVPPGERMILASVDGHAPRLQLHTYS
jgi:hypothetical protein